MVGEPEVVVRAEQQDALAVEQHARPLRAGDEAHAAVEPELLQLVEAVLDLALPCDRSAVDARAAFSG